MSFFLSIISFSPVSEGNNFVLRHEKLQVIFLKLVEVKSICGLDGRIFLLPEICGNVSERTASDQKPLVAVTLFQT